ncbi:MAG: DUF4962 domain-containing protein, partial [Lentisphaerae bacterium]|nr:DUF4962 domain-containing protein [Lentisphaerota bacterium]
DWLYHDLTEDERRQIREKVVPRAEKLAHAGFSKIPFWHQAYLQNHLWVSVAGMATTAFAVADEVPEATSWICFAHDKFIRTLEALGDDGASHEGYGYWEYGAEYIMRYLELADTCLGIDLYHDSSGVPHPWLSRNSAYALYLALPRGMWTRKQSIVDLADCPRNHWYGPSYLLRNLARRYPEPPWQGTAQWLAAEFEAAGVDVTGSGHYLNFAWHNPRIPARPPKDDTLPLWHHFDDIGIVSARSDWENDAALLVVTCGPPLGHRHAASMKDYGAGHVHPDAGHFVLVAGGETLFRDSGYTAPKLTGNHSTLLIKDKEQKGGGKTWYVYGDWLLDERVPTIQSVTNTDDQTVIDCAVAGAYPAHVGLRTFDRTFEFARSGTLTIRDRVALETESALEWRLQTEGPLEQLSDTEWRTTVGRMSATIRIRADVPVVLNAGSLEINQHLRTQTRPYLAVKTTGSVTRAQLETVIDWRGNAP